MDELCEYFKGISIASKNCRSIVIYGAGRKAIALYDVIRANTDIKISAFMVTSLDENKSEERGTPIVDVKDNPYLPDDTLVLIGVRKRWNDIVKNTLLDNGYTNVIDAPENIDFLGGKDQERLESAVLQITSQVGCAINCRYCPQKLFINKYLEHDSQNLIMTFESFKKYIDKVDSSVILEFAGFSEPFFNSDTVRMLEYANEKGYSIELFTTLMGMTMGDFERIKHIPFREVVLHLPDENENSHIDISDDYLKLLRRVINYKTDSGKHFVDWGSCHGKISNKVIDLVVGKIRVLTQLHDRAGNLSASDIETTGYKYGQLSCSGSPNLNHSVLLPNGDVLLCDSDWGMKHVIGSLCSQTYNQIINGEEIKKIKKAISEEESDVLCRYCSYAVVKGGKE